MWDKIEEFYIVNVFYGFPFSAKKVYFIIKVNGGYFRLLFSPPINIKKQVTINVVKYLSVGADRNKIYLFSRPDNEDKELDIEEIEPFIKLVGTYNTNCNLRRII